MRRLKIDILGNTISTLYQPGSRTPLLLIHGNSSCKEIFAKQIIPLVAKGYGLIVPDLPGHGDSGNARTPQSTYSFPGYAAVLRSLMEQLGVFEFHVLGWSLGGHIGLELWSQSSQVKSLILTGTPPVHLNPLGAASGFRASPVMDLAGKKSFNRADAVSYCSAMLDAEIDGRTRIARTVMRTDGRARYWMLRNSLAGVGSDQVNAVAQCCRPLAIVQGQSDAFVNVEYLRSLKYRNLWLNAPLLIDAGHAPHWTTPRMFNRYVSAFLEQFD